MKIANDHVVQFHYQLLDEEEIVLEDSHKAQPQVYLHGKNNIFPALEEKLLGLAAGEHATVTLAAEETYGHIRENASQRIPIKHLKRKGKVRIGDIVLINTDQGERQVTVTKVGKFVVDVDSNHPYAGKSLTFKVEIIDVRAATEEELSHNHAHGPGGHQH